MWFGILKAELFPERWMGILKFTAAMRPSQINKPEEVEVELDTDALADSCCEQAKLNFIQVWQRLYDETQVPETEEVVNYAMDGDYTCDELRGVIQHMVNSRSPHPLITEIQGNMQQILDEWEECENVV